MNVRVENDEIVKAVTALIVERIPDAKVTGVVFTRQRGGQVYADVTVGLGKPK